MIVGQQRSLAFTRLSSKPNSTLRNAVRQGSREGCWNTTPRSSPGPLTSRPSTPTTPRRPTRTPRKCWQSRQSRPPLRQRKISPPHRQLSRHPPPLPHDAPDQRRPARTHHMVHRHRSHCPQARRFYPRHRLCRHERRQRRYAPDPLDPQQILADSLRQAVATGRSKRIRVVIDGAMATAVVRPDGSILADSILHIERFTGLPIAGR